VRNEPVSNASALRTIIFDCGRVITLDQDMAYSDKMAEFLGAPKAAFREAYSAERHDYDRGTIDAPEYWRRVAARLNATRLGASISDADLAHLIELDIRSWFSINPATVEIIHTLKKRGYRLLMLSNMNLEGKECLLGPFRTMDGLDWIALFDEVLLSCDLKLLKPERAIYEACLSLAHAEPEACVFIDDTPKNVEAARACGMRGIDFTDAASLRAALAPELEEVRADL
jgi:putative hydrolase of the HAD superfamily